jgi:membrane protein DedA with SNARE-associated domain/pimeloyl-ACP methyl ester carboxylesterase
MITLKLTWRRRWRWRLIAIYLGLLALSHLVQWARPPHGFERPGQHLIQVPAFDEDGDPTGDFVSLYYYDLQPPGKPDAPVVVLIHGSPLASSSLQGLAQALAADFHVIVPDLPGFGASAGPVLPDYSTQTHAQQVQSLLVQLKIHQANIIGYGRGGGVALEFADADPEAVQSLVLLSSVGPVEYEWLGDPVLNHALYGVQLAVITAAQELLPHFGILDITPINEAYARSFWDTDQRHLRDILQDYRQPMLILHGQDDFFEPVAGARESNRLVPQSEIQVWPGRLNPNLHPEQIAPAIRDFIQRAQHGLATVKANADPARLAQSIQDMSAPARAAGTYEVMILVLLAFATFIAEDLTCIAAGLLVARGVLGFWMASFACFVGIYTGDLLLYAAGRWFGRPMLRYAPFRWWIKESDLWRLSESFDRRGVWLIFISRFIPASRLPLFLGAGILHYSFVRMALALLVAGGLWTPPFVGAAYLVGQQMLAWVERYEKAAFYVLIAVVLVMFAVVHVVLPLCTWRGRRLWLSRWRRLSRWEFWPWWLLYAPVFGYVLKLAWKHRGLTVFTCANPALPAGGFVEESKSAILRGLDGAGAVVARWILLPAAVPDSPVGRIQELDTWMEAHGLSWPIVLKPDIGERGQGVAICRVRERAERYLTSNPAAIIAQEFVPGAEYGIFYYRHPGESTGHIFSITDKRFPSVTGDGVHNLERLILADDRAVCSARFFLGRYSPRLLEVPPDGTVVPLVELGTHCRGALFLDGTAELATPELTAAVDAISQTFPGFYFGRYDIRCPSADDLRAGRNLRIIELNGVTSEATAIYDPRNSPFHAWRLLCRQWRLCYEIGAANRDRGAQPIMLRQAIRAFIHSRSTFKFEA